MTLDPSLRHWHTRLDDLDACAEHAPEGLYTTALAVRGLIGDTADRLIRDVLGLGLGLDADNSDDIRDVEAALYRYVVRSNLGRTEFTSAESFGRHAADPDTRDRVIANAIRDRDALADKGVTDPYLDVEFNIVGIGDRVQLTEFPYSQGTITDMLPGHRLAVRHDDDSVTRCPASMVRLIPVPAPATNPDRAQVAAIGTRPDDTPSQALERLCTPVNLTATAINRLATLAADHQRLSDAMVDHGKGHTAIRLLLPRGYVNIADQVAYDVLTVVDSRVCDEARRMGVELLTTTETQKEDLAND